MSTDWHFPVLVVVSLLVFVGILHAVLHSRREPPRLSRMVWVAIVVVVGGMSFARMGALSDLPVWVYYGIPAALTWLLPPVVFRMSARELTRYLPMALLVAPFIHVVFAFFFGWKEYMPFIPVPSLRELFG